MKKLLLKLLPDMAAAFQLGLIVLVVLNSRNPTMSFLTSDASIVFILCAAAVTLAALLALLCHLERRPKNNPSKMKEIKD